MIGATYWQTLILPILLGESSKVFQFNPGKGCGTSQEIKLLKTPRKPGEVRSCSIEEYLAEDPSESPLSIAKLEVKLFGGWTQWTEASACSSTCGSGYKRRDRECTSDRPEHYCLGPKTWLRYCNPKYCPVHGSWSQWTPWTSCNAECTVIQETRQRECRNPAPKHGGDDCPGDTNEVRPCSIAISCPVDGQWSDWSDWTLCALTSTTCGSGTQSRSRSCSNPAPANGGHDCSGSLTTQSQSCAIGCPVAGSWTLWSTWSECTMGPNCGNDGTRSLQRSCNNPPPQFGGADCLGEDTITESCIILCKETGQVIQVESLYGDEGSWEHCPNAFHPVAFRSKESQGSGLTGLKFRCNNPAQTEISSKEYSGGTYPGYATNCDQGFTRIRGRVLPYVGWEDDRTTLCIEVYCEESQAWHKSNCDDREALNAFDAPEMACPTGLVICGIRTTVDETPPFSDNTAVGTVKMQCCLRP